MVRRAFLKTASSEVATLMGVAGFHVMKMPNNVNSPISVDLGDGYKIHAFSTGHVSVKQAHREYEGLESLRFPAILADWRWTEPMPIWVWLLEYPGGLVLIDTGENSEVCNPNYFDNTGSSGLVNRSILDFEVTRNQEIDSQLRALGFTAKDIQQVILTHLHLDHVDGLSHFGNSEVILSKVEWQNPYGHVPELLPSWLKPRLVVYESTDLPITKACHLNGGLYIIPTPGHTYGHQSVLLFQGEYCYFFAGDTSFSEQQLQQEKFAGICIDLDAARQTYAVIKKLAKEFKIIYLPSHDPLSVERLKSKSYLRVL